MLNILEQVCQELETVGSLNKEHFDGILEFLRVFVDKCHHGKEEDLLFPALIAGGVPKEGPIAVMLHEHEMGRRYVKAMSEAYATYLVADKPKLKRHVYFIAVYMGTRSYFSCQTIPSQKNNDTESMKLLIGCQKNIEEVENGFGKRKGMGCT